MAQYSYGRTLYTQLLVQAVLRERVSVIRVPDEFRVPDFGVAAASLCLDVMIILISSAPDVNVQVTQARNNLARAPRKDRSRVTPFPLSMPLTRLA